MKRELPGSTTSRKDASRGYGKALGYLLPTLPLLAGCATASAESPTGTPTPFPTKTPEPTPPTPMPENYVAKGQTFMGSVLNEYLTGLSDTERKQTLSSLDGSTISTVMVTKDGLSYRPERNYIGDHILTMSVVRSKTGQLSFLFYDLTSAQDRARLLDLRMTPDGHIVGVDRKTGSVLLTIDGAYQFDDKDRLVLNPSATIAMKWNGSDKYQDLRVEVDENRNPLQGALVSGQIFVPNNQQPSREQIALSNDNGNGGESAKPVGGLLSIVNRDRANLPLLDPKKDGIYIPSLKEKGVSPFIPALEQSPAFDPAISAYVRAMNSAKKPTDPALELAGVKDNLVIQQLTDYQGNPFFVAVATDGTPLMVAEMKNGMWTWNEAVLKNIAEKSGFLIGNFIDNRPGNSKRADQILASEFNMMQPGVFYWDWMRKGGENAPIDFSLSDAWVTFAKRNGLQIISQSLIYQEGIPQWLQNGKYSKDQMITIMTDHIKSVIRHHKGDINMWIVLNEAIWEYQGSVGYTDSIWYRKIGKDYIELAYKAAREADPSAVLIYNDFTNEIAGKGSEIDGYKSQVVFNLVKDLKKKDLVDAVGIQAHFFDGAHVPTKEQILTQIKKYNAIGVRVVFTEVDLNIKPLLDSGYSREEALRIQGEGFVNLVEACKEAGEGCIGVNFYGINDETSWAQRMGGVSPVLQSGNQRKFAYYSILKSLLK